MVKLKDLVEDLELGKVYTDKDRPPFQVKEETISEGPDADLGKKLKQIQNQIYKLEIINNDKFNNKLENLQRISQRKNTSKDKKRELPVGVDLSKSKNNPYKARIRHNSKLFHIGMYNTITKASNAYEINRQRIEILNLRPIKI
mgnify:CR=1 FL=1